jgi:hypothetical protein
MPSRYGEWAYTVPFAGYEKNMPENIEERSEEELSVEQLSNIGMNALLGMGSKVSRGLECDALHYDTSIDGEKGDLAMLDLIAVMLPYVEERPIIISPGAPGNANVGGDVVAGDKNVIAFEMDSALICTMLGKRNIAAVHQFIGYFIVEIRRIICKNKKSSQNLGHATTGALAALAAWVVESFHVASPIATAVAAGILVTVTTASKNAFCRMTEAQVAEVFPKPAKKAQKNKD